MTKPDFDAMMRACFGPCRCAGGFKERGLVAPDCSICNDGPEVLAALHTAYSAGLERAAEVADNDASVGNQEIRVKTAAWRIAKAIRTEKENTP